jgi:DNA-binding IclR family transcriptional regulator
MLKDPLVKRILTAHVWLVCKGSGRYRIGMKLFRLALFHFLDHRIRGD